MASFSRHALIGRMLRVPYHYHIMRFACYTVANSLATMQHALNTTSIRCLHANQCARPSIAIIRSIHAQATMTNAHYDVNDVPRRRHAGKSSMESVDLQYEREQAKLQAKLKARSEALADYERRTLGGPHVSAVLPYVVAPVVCCAAQQHGPCSHHFLSHHKQSGGKG